MLQNARKKNDVVTVKLVSGEEVIGYFESENANAITIRKPLVPVPASETSMVLAPFIMSGEQSVGGNLTVELNKQTVVTVLKTNEQFTKEYQRLVSGLDFNTQAPPPGLITT
jgi:hypothetical protein